MTDIHDARILIVATNGFEQLELTMPREELRKAGATVDVATPDGKPIRGWNKTDWGETVDADLEIAEARLDDYHALVLPGGQINPDLLRKHDVALVCADTVDWPLLMDITADFIYVRLHGSTELYKSAYSRPALERWAGRVAAWRDGQPMTDGHFISARQPKARPRDVFLYFDNTDKLQAPEDARSLMQRLGLA